MLASTLARGASSLPPDARHDARMIHDLSVRSAAFCRRLYSGLMPVELDRQGLCGALDHLAASTSSGFRVSCAFRNGLHADITSSAVKLHAYRIAQEAVANAIRHADATKIRIAIAGQRGNIVMSVEDNGAGIRPGKRRTGMGLHIMNNRARMIGGVLDVVPGRHGGTRVVCTWRNT
jgi:signal transduction histidine kinase